MAPGVRVEDLYNQLQQSYEVYPFISLHFTSTTRRNYHKCSQPQRKQDRLSIAPGHNDPLYIDDLETLLDEGALAFNLQIEDGSFEEVAEELMIMHEECLSGNFGSVERLREASHNPVPYPRAEQKNIY